MLSLARWCRMRSNEATPLSSQGPEALMARTPVIERIEGSKDRVTGAPPPHRDSVKRNAPPKRGISVVMVSASRPLNLSSVKDADRQPLVTTGAGGGYLPIGALPTGHLPTGGGAGGGGSLRGRSAAAAALSIANDAASAVRIFSMM